MAVFIQDRGKVVVEGEVRVWAGGREGAEYFLGTLELIDHFGYVVQALLFQSIQFIDPINFSLFKGLESVGHSRWYIVDRCYSIWVCRSRVIYGDVSGHTLWHEGSFYVIPVLIHPLVQFLHSAAYVLFPTYAVYEIYHVLGLRVKIEFDVELFFIGC